MDGDEQLPEGWVKVKSKSRPDKVYFHNAKLKLSLWTLEDLKKFQLKEQAAKENGSRKSSPRKSSVVPSKKPIPRVSEHSKNIKKNTARERMTKLQTVLSEEVQRDEKLPPRRSNHVKKFEKFKEVVDVRNAYKNDKKNVAAERMKRLNEKLLQEKKQESQNNNYASLSASKSSDVPMKVADDPIKESIQEIADEEMEISFEEPSEEIQHEMMDWEEIPEQEIILHVQKMRTVEGFVKATTLVTSGKAQAIEFYVIVDTNVLLSNVDFLKDIKGKIFKDIGKATIYLPYIVLCELDKLKTYNDNVAKLARRAIAFIDDCFKQKDSSLMGQSALENLQAKTFPVDTADDEILNCCLQTKEKTKKMILLSNDKNLRNKAFVNRIEAYSRDMLYLIDYNYKNDIKFD